VKLNVRVYLTDDGGDEAIGAWDADPINDWEPKVDVPADAAEVAAAIAAQLAEHLIRTGQPSE